MMASLRRLRGLLRKEFLQIWRDPSSLAIAFLLPAVLLFLFGYGVSLDASNVPLALVVQRPSALAASFAGAFEQSPYFRPRRFLTIQEAEQAMTNREVQGVVWLPSDFDRRAVSGGNSPIGLFVNGVDTNTARIVEGYVQQVWADWLAARAAEAGRPAPLPIALQARVRFNPAVKSRDFIVPGLIAMIMTLSGALLTALVIAREWERGTMEALMVTRVTIREILIAKLIPYFVLGMGGMAATVALGVFRFEVPLRGWLLISSAARSQFVAAQIAIIATFLPAFILSGFVFDINSMPWPVQIITYAVAARYFVAILQSTFLAGDVWSVILPNAAALIAIAAIFLGAARALARKRLD